MSTLAEQAARLPKSPGVYLFKNAKGDVLYVGKARNLQSRVRQYLSGHDERPQVRPLVLAAKTVDVVLVNTEKEALILESTLIRKHQPRYNVRLLEGASFLHLRIDTTTEWPTWTLTRRIGQDGSKPGVRYIGPVPSAQQARSTLSFINRRFPLRTCTDDELKRRKRPCLLHQMKRCIAPCVNLCTKQEYDAVVSESLMFLEGRSDELRKRLEERMAALAAEERFEEAAAIRDQIRAIAGTVERQQMVDAKGADRDVWGLFRQGPAGMATRLPVRGGAVHEPLPMRIDAAIEDDESLLSSLLNAFYQAGAVIPEEILLPLPLPDGEALEELLSERRGRAVRVHAPQRGPKHQLVEIAVMNARAALEKQTSEVERRRQVLQELQRICDLPKLPLRIECFDNSNIQGSDPVASMAVFVDGQPARNLYRRFVIKGVVGSDDFESMKEVLSRRMQRALAEEPGSWRKPDLIVVDGGKGQLNAALAALKELDIVDMPVIGLAKPRTERKRGDRQTPDKIVLPGVKDPIVLRPNHPVLHMLQALRDETHRTAVMYHRQRRTKRQFTSSLLDLPGVGETRRLTLLKRFGSIEGVLAASAEDIAALPGFNDKLARAITDAIEKAKASTKDEEEAQSPPDSSADST